MDDATPSPSFRAAALGVDAVADRMVVIRGRRVMLDRDLAAVYGVAPKRLNEQVKRNQPRFPDDFLFRLTLQVARTLVASRSHSATLKRGANVKHPPYAFTEHGAVMLAAVLDSPVAIAASIERKFDQQFGVVFDAIRQLMTPPTSRTARIGFRGSNPDPTPHDSGDS